MGLSCLSEETGQRLFEDCEEDVDDVLWITWRFEKFRGEKKGRCYCVLSLILDRGGRGYFESMLSEACYVVELLEEDHCCSYRALRSVLSEGIQRGGTV